MDPTAPSTWVSGYFFVCNFHGNESHYWSADGQRSLPNERENSAAVLPWGKIRYPSQSGDVLKPTVELSLMEHRFLPSQANTTRRIPGNETRMDCC